MENRFLKAMPIWAERLEREKNITLGLYKKIFSKGEKVILKIAVSGFYKVYLNGKFVYFGPARSAHGYYRVDEINLKFVKGENHLAIETVNYYINSFYSLYQAAFIQAELISEANILAATGYCKNDFQILQLKERVQKVQRYSSQRAFTEAYNLENNSFDWRMGRLCSNAVKVRYVITEKKKIISRNIPLNNFPQTFSDKTVARGVIKSGIKPDKYRKDHSLINVNMPSKGNLLGFYEDELEVHLSDEIQEFLNIKNTECDELCNGKSCLESGDFEIRSFLCEKSGFINLDVNCNSDGILYILFDEILTDGDVNPFRLSCCNAIKICFKEGKYNFISAEPYGLKYIKLICVDGSIEINKVSVIETVCPVPIIFDYKSNDEEINKILLAARESFMQNSFDLLTDCPTRERAGWLCDSFFLGRAEKTFTGQNLIEKNFLENYLLPDRFEYVPDGMLPMCYPSDWDIQKYIPNWAMWFILELDDYIKRSADKMLSDKFKNKVYGIVYWFEKYENSDGLLEKLPAWVFVEWSKANEFVQDVNFPTNMLYSMMLDCVARLYNDKELNKKSVNLRRIIRKRSFNGEFFRDNEVYIDGELVATDNFTETCQYYAFFTGVASPELFPKLWDILKNSFGPHRIKDGIYPGIYTSNAFIGNLLRLELLGQYGEYEQLQDEIKGYYLYMAETTGTLWENADITSGCNSCNHGFASYIATLIEKAKI